MSGTGTPPLFRDRAEAGRRLARELRRLRGLDVVVLGLPRGGVPVAAEVARALGAPLDVAVVRKIAVPGRPLLAMGAVGEDGGVAVNTDVVKALGISWRDLHDAEAAARAEVRRLVPALRGAGLRVPLAGRVVVVVDDGIGTGATARAACHVARTQGAAEVVLAVPFAHAAAVEALTTVADDIVCLHRVNGHRSISDVYEDGAPIGEAQVTALLRHLLPRRSAAPERVRHVRDDSVVVNAGTIALPGRLIVPPDAVGVILLAHAGAGNWRGPQTRRLAGLLHQARLGSLVLDLVSDTEDLDRRVAFDLGLLTARLAASARWLHTDLPARMPVGLYGVGRAAAAALSAASMPMTRAFAVVSQGGRIQPNLDRLAAIRVPTLLIVGRRDPIALELTMRARERLSCPNRLAVVPGADRRFEEPGTAQLAGRLAADWFVRHLAGEPCPPLPQARTAQLAAARSAGR